MRILFWNTHNNNNINVILSELIIENKINIAAMAEYSADIDELIHLLSVKGILMKEYCTAGCERIKIIGNIENVIPAAHDDHFSFQIINDTYIMCCVHLPSKIYTNNAALRVGDIKDIISGIRNAEIYNNTENSFIIGDFNANPFDDELIYMDSLNSLPIYETTAKKVRKIKEHEYLMFYNPMWNLFGDFEAPYGTYYYGKNTIDNIYWHILDQVIIRPNLRDSFVDKSLKIITKTNSVSLLNKKGHPDKKTSDHLPIVFEIKEN